MNRLQQKGHRALTAGDGRTALQFARDEHPDLILLDMMMPEMDGLEVLRRLKADPVTADPPVILFSAVDDPKMVAAAMRSGAREYWVKASFNFEELPRRLELAIQVQHDLVDAAHTGHRPWNDEHVSGKVVHRGIGVSDRSHSVVRRHRGGGRPRHP